MKRSTPLIVAALASLLAGLPAMRAEVSAQELEQTFVEPVEGAKPWTFWYWMSAAVSKAGITADLEAMNQVGLGGAYLVPIKGAAKPPLSEPVVEQLSPVWWDHIRHAFKEADRLGLKFAMHASDGFATAGGPWITPDHSMQKIVFASAEIEGGRGVDLQLPQPEKNRDYYRDLQIVAFPPAPGAGESSRTRSPVVTTSKPETDAQFLATASSKYFTSAEACWIQYAFADPFTLRSLTVRAGRTTGIQQNTYHANRLLVEASDDGVEFRPVIRLEPPRHGWQDGDADVTHAIPETTAKVFRFSFDPQQSAPGEEELDSAKWKKGLKIHGIDLSSDPRLHQFEGKTGAVWRLSPTTSDTQIPSSLCVQPKQIIDLTGRVSPEGKLLWDAPAGRWQILRIGVTTTGYTNYTGGGGLGLECDKFDAEIARLQFDRWIGETLRQVGPALAKRVLRLVHVDSWECGSQNWSPVMRAEFQRRRGYDLQPWLPVMAGVPIKSVADSERFLHDLRQTIAELVVDNFYRPIATLAHENGLEFSGESVAPTMLSDGLLHHGAIDVPMGEFWLRSPTHDKLNDMLDAISGAHIYGRKVVQAEAFTELRIQWDEDPAMLKKLGDRNFALGVNRFVFHVFTHNPWLNRRPGMSLGGTGLYFQRDQIWWTQAHAWVKYVQRCSSLLQQGLPVVDLAVFTGEELPRRAILPWQLAESLPAFFPADDPRRQEKILDANDWVDPLAGYAYDSINPDALLRLARVERRALTLPGGPTYRILLVPAAPLSPMAKNKIRQFSDAGLKIIDVGARAGVGASGHWTRATFGNWDVLPDFEAREADGPRARGVAWTHRQGKDWDFYFVSNQEETARDLALSLRVAGRVPELWDPVTGERRVARTWSKRDGRTELAVRLPPAGSLFVVLRQPTPSRGDRGGENFPEPAEATVLNDAWRLTFDSAFGGPAAPLKNAKLQSWTESADLAVKHYSGVASYAQTFTWKRGEGRRVWLDLGRVKNIAEVQLNGVPCGVAWTSPYRVEVTSALRDGANDLKISVANTWFNRLALDRTLPEAQRLTQTTVPERTEGKPLLEAGLLGPVQLLSE